MLPSWLKRILPASKTTQLRRFDGAQFNRLTQSFIQSERSINTELRGDLDALRRRSRNLSKNEPMARKYLSMVCTNVAGANGFSLQARVLNGNVQDVAANNAIEAAWLAWSAQGVCEVSGRMSMPELTRAIVRAVARDGEALVRERQGYQNGFGYALQLLDIERLDTTFSREAGKGINAVIMGVEINDEGRAEAFWMGSARFGRDSTGRNLERIPASQIIHLFKTDDPEQVRGIPWMHASMVRMHHLKGYEEAAIIAARVGASKMGFFTQSEAAQGDLTSVLAAGVDSEGVPFTEADPGQFGMLPAGYGFTPFNPDYPHDQYPEFTKAAKRDIGSGFNAAYHSLANDLEGVSFSSIRSGTLEERDNWMADQNWFIDAFLERVYRHWLDNALLSGAIVLPNGSPLPATKFTKFLPHIFMGRRWQWVDPLKDVQAAVMSLENGLASPYSLASQQGLDADDVLDDIARFQAAAKAKGVTLGSTAPQPAPAKSDETKIEGEEE